VIVVLDTNVLLVSLPKGSKFRLIFDAFLQNKYILTVSNEVLSEYVEVIGEHISHSVASNIAELLTSRDNVRKNDVYFRWNLISADADDNKFTDLFVASNADYLVTNDSHFREVSKISFPKINIINVNDFLKLLSENKD